MHFLFFSLVIYNEQYLNRQLYLLLKEMLTDRFSVIRYTYAFSLSRRFTRKSHGIDAMRYKLSTRCELENEKLALPPHGKEQRLCDAIPLPSHISILRVGERKIRPAETKEMATMICCREKSFCLLLVRKRRDASRLNLSVSIRNFLMISSFY